LCHGPSVCGRPLGPHRPPFCRDARGIQAGARPIDRVCLTQSVEYGEVEAVPDASLLPVTQPAPAGDTTAAAEFLGQILPGESRLEHEENAGECRPIWDAGTAAFGFGKFRWEQRCD